VQGAAEPGQGLSNLVAEDNPVNQRLAARLLEKRGHRVNIAGNGQEALDALSRSPFELVLMDVQMPEMDGLTATSILRERGTWQRHSSTGYRSDRARHER
jgi:two-component system sensor histidine kinase/response regulator